MAELPMKRSCLTFKALRIPSGIPELPFAIPHDLIEVPQGVVLTLEVQLHTLALSLCVSVCSPSFDFGIFDLMTPRVLPEPLVLLP